MSKLRCEKQTIRSAIDHAEIKSYASVRLCSDCCKVARELLRYPDGSVDIIVSIPWDASLFALETHREVFSAIVIEASAERGLPRDTGHFRTRNNLQAKTSMRSMKLGLLQDLFGKNTMQAKNEQKKLQKPSTTQNPKMTQQTSKNKKATTEDAPSTELTVTQIPRRRGAPSIYSKEIVKEILWRLGSGQTLKKYVHWTICQM